MQLNIPRFLAAISLSLALSCSSIPKTAKSHLPCIPAGFRLASGRKPEPYTNTEWAQEVIHAKTGIVMVYIPAGSFVMGSPKSEQDMAIAAGLMEKWARFEGPQHKVTISKGFYLGKYEVTQGEWQNIMGNNPSRFQNAGLRSPVERVSWDDCQEFCRRAGSDLRLPTEAEWEYACRTGSTTALYSGKIKIIGRNNAPVLDCIAWYGGNSGVDYEEAFNSSHWVEKQYDHRRAGTHPVGMKKPNRWGLYDMIGNVREWCQDWYSSKYYQISPEHDPVGSKSGVYRVTRGGSWYDDAGDCRSSCRDIDEPGVHNGGLGFRVAATLPVQ